MDDEADPMPMYLELVGARLLGPAPIEDVWVPLETGVHALYGKNGAGKSRLLYALADLYAGIPSEHGSYLVARVNEYPDRVRERTPRFSGISIDAYPVNQWEVPRLQSARWQRRSTWSSLVGEALWPLCVALSGTERKVPNPYLLDDGDVYAQLDDVDELDEESRREVFARVEEAEYIDEAPLERTAIIAMLDEIAEEDLVALTPDDGGWIVAPVLRGDHCGPKVRQAMNQILRVRPWLRRGDPIEEALEIEGMDHLNNLIVLLSPFFDIVRDRTDDIAYEAECCLLEAADTVPYRLGMSDAFRGFRFDLGLVGEAPTVLRDDHLNYGRLQMATQLRLYASTIESRQPIVQDNNTVSPDLARSAERLTAGTQTIYEQLLLDAPRLELTVRPPHEWFLDLPIDWTARAGSESLSLEHLSQAQLRWASVAIGVAEARAPRWEPANQDPHRLPLLRPPLLVLLDEPDAALHATAQRHSVDGLVDLASDGQTSVYVATHSREFLNHPDITPHHVSRNGLGRAEVRALDATSRERVDDLGLEPADLLLLHRAVLVVEGQHDLVVLDELVGPALRRLGVLVLPMRGGRLTATVVDSYLLAHFADMPVIAALDNLEAERIEQYWNALVAAEPCTSTGIDGITKEHFPNRSSDEQVFLIQYCRAAAELGQSGPFRVFGFSQPDIIDFLPVEHLVPGARSWGELRAQFAGQSKIRSFKPWLKQTRGIEFTELSLREAAAAIGPVPPPEFVRLLDTCSRSQQRRSRGCSQAIP